MKLPRRPRGFWTFIMIKVSIIKTAEFKDNNIIVNGDELLGEYAHYVNEDGSERWSRSGLVNIRKENTILSFDQDFSLFAAYGELLMVQHKIKSKSGHTMEFVKFNVTNRTKVRI